MTRAGAAAASPVVETQPALGVVAPLLAEARCLVPQPRPAGMHRSGRCLVAVSGVGPEAAGAAAESLAAAGCRLLVSFGTAGALDASLDSGDLLLTSVCVQAGEPAARVAESTKDASQKDRSAPVEALVSALVAATAACGEPRVLCQAPILSVPRVVADPATRAALAVGSGASAIDMESAAIAEVAARRGLGFLAIRAIVDTVSGPLPQGLEGLVDRWGRPRLRLALALLARPWLLSSLLPLARRMAHARRTLTACAPCLCATSPRPSGRPFEAGTP
jgi:nucleoside phosphorylase